MPPESPTAWIEASDRTRVWTLASSREGDGFQLARRAPASLLLLAMHQVDERPWICARRPVHLSSSPSACDEACKRILGKRFRLNEIPPDRPAQSLDPIPLILSRVAASGFDGSETAAAHPSQFKKPGHLLPRDLRAVLTVRAGGETFTWHARNYTELSQSLHAEMILVLALSRWVAQNPGLSLESLHLHSTLKPCRMCAAFLHELRTHTEDFRVSYTEDDPGPLAQATALDIFGYAGAPTKDVGPAT